MEAARRGVTPCLLHLGDVMHHGNLLLDARGRIAAILDYVESTAGDPRWELAWFDYYFTPSEREPMGRFDLVRFRAAYGTDHDPSDLPGRFYLIGILVFEKLLYYDPASQRGQWAIGALKEALRTIGSTV
jgi:Phosphotransferase enzyme family